MALDLEDRRFKPVSDRFKIFKAIFKAIACLHISVNSYNYGKSYTYIISKQQCKIVPRDRGFKSLRSPHIFMRPQLSGQSTGLRNQVSWVRIPPGVPLNIPLEVPSSLQCSVMKVYFFSFSYYFVLLLLQKIQYLIPLLY